MSSGPRLRGGSSANDAGRPAARQDPSLKLLYLTHNFPRHADDMAGAFLLALAHGQQALGHEVRVVAPHAAGLADREVVAGVEVVRHRYGPDAEETLAYAGTMHEQALRSWKARWRLLAFVRASRAALRRECRSWRPNVVHVHWWVPGGFAFWPGKRVEVPIVLTSHGTDLFLLDRFPSARSVAARVFRRAAQVTVISTPLVARVEALGVPRERITVLPMPLTMGRFESTAGVPRIPDQFLFVGRLIERKGAEYAILAVAALRQQGRGVHLVVVGDGPDRRKLAALATELGVSDSVQLTGSLSHDEVAAHYRTACALLMPAVTDWKGEQEGFGMVLVEAMASGLPIVASRSGGISDVVVDDESGLLVPERDVPALASAAARLLDDPALVARLAEAGRRRLQERFSPERIAQGFDAVYRRATGGR